MANIDYQTGINHSLIQDSPLPGYVAPVPPSSETDAEKKESKKPESKLIDLTDMQDFDFP